ncbi:MAG: metalloregulator ArsR/SmtB family transcription factor [Hyphomicrobiales bacterium]|nr:metalloregulator ArsR/SmtB family transcription factor [Hyphomicrobiales bacterium]
MPTRNQAVTQISLETALAALAAAGEETRLRIVALIAQSELTVSELVAILGQSQPRVSRHLKLLVEAGLAQRHREGAWAFFTAAQSGPGAEIVREIAGRLDPVDASLAADRERLAEIRKQRAEHAARYFAAHARDWDQLRKMHAPETEVERAILDIVGERPVQALLDCGTGTGRMLELLARHADRAIGVDLSPAMLSVARANLDRAGVRNAQLRQGDIYALPIERNSIDLAIVHQVLHYLDDPARALREASRALKAAGRLMVVDFAPHEEEHLRERHAHRRLGFSHEEIAGLLGEAGLDVVERRDLSAARGAQHKLTVSIWLAQDRRMVTDIAPRGATEFA